MILGCGRFSDWAWDSFLTMTHCGRFLRPTVKKVLLYYMDLLVKSEDLISTKQSCTEALMAYGW